jgi:virginiamycin B lyase
MVKILFPSEPLLARLGAGKVAGAFSRTFLPARRIFCYAGDIAISAGLRTLAQIGLAAFGLLLASCGGASSVPAARPAAGAGTVPVKAHKIKASIRIAVPKRAHRRRIRMHGHYVSPATQSIAIAITPQTGSPTTQNTNLTAGTPGCAQSLVSPLICTVTLTLAAGNYTATFTTYDGTLDGSGNPTGQQLSANQNVPLDIVLGHSNDINVTLEGIPTAVAVVPGPSSDFSGSTTSGFSISRCASTAQPVDVLGVDADNNYIIGPGAPAVSLASNDPSIAVATPGPAAPNRFVLTLPGIPSVSTVQLTASATPAAGSGAAAPPNAQVNVSFTHPVCGVYAEFAYNAHTSVGGIAVASGKMYFGDKNDGEIVGLATSGSMQGISSLSAPPQQLTAGPASSLWFSEEPSSVGSISTAGGTNADLAEYPVPTATSDTQGIALGPDGNMWFTEVVANQIGVVDPTGTTFHEYPLPTAASNPLSIAAGPDGNLWFAECNNDKIGRITTAGVITEFSLPSNRDQATSIIAGPDGNLWFAENATRTIGKITTAGVVTDFGQTAGNPTAIAIGPDNQLWVAETCSGSPCSIAQVQVATGAITEWTTGNASAAGIVTGPDEDLWFTENGPNGAVIGRMQ